MTTQKPIDDLTGTETTGHEWDGIKELNTPLPRWWLWTFYGTILFAIGYTIAYPAWPMISSATTGVLGYSSRATLDRERNRIDVVYTEGPFKYLNNHWIFEPDGQGGTMLDFYVDFEFRSIVLQKVIGVVFNEAVRRMVGAFEARAKELYG